MNSYSALPLSNQLGETVPLKPNDVKVLTKPEDGVKVEPIRASTISYARGFTKSNQIFKTIPDGFKLELFELVQDLHKDEFRVLIEPYVKITEKNERLIDLRDHDNRSLLSVAAFKGNYYNVGIILELYTKAGVSPYSEDKNGNNALELACIRGYNSYSGALSETGRTKRYEVVARLLSVGGDPKS